ncbi:MAG: SH3 domain-containing protein [Paludibacteraceae bacterium]|nr:SH3 domain-containing protein [Paludibacteraceae bacterium]
MTKKRNAILAIGCLFVGLITACVSVSERQTTITEEKKEFDKSTLSEMEKEKQYAEKECEVLKMFFEDKRYVFPSREEFKKRCSDYWGINVDTIPNVYFTKGGDQLFTDCMIFRFGSETVYYYPSYESQIKGESKGDAKEAYDAMKYEDDSLDYNYNQLLFHDDIRALSKILNFPEHVFNIVYNHNYEKNKLFLEKAASMYSWPENRDWKDLRYALFYNNLERGIRKDFIKQITHFKNEKPENYTNPRNQPDFYEYINKYIDIYDYIDVPLELKDECLCYMIVLLYEFCKDFNNKNSCGEAFGAYECIDNMVSMHGYGFIERVTKNKYYGYPQLKEIFDLGLSVNMPFGDPNRDGELDAGYVVVFGRVIDKDGYVNLRDGADVKSNIIGTISTGEDVIVCDMTQEEIESAQMLKVRTKDKKNGFVHKSRLKLYSRHTDENRKSILESYNLPYIKEYEW